MSKIIESIESQIEDLDIIDSSKFYRLYKKTIQILEAMQNLDITLEQLKFHIADRFMRTMFFLNIDVDQVMEFFNAQKRKIDTVQEPVMISHSENMVKDIALAINETD